MKRTLALLLALLMMVGVLAGCSGGEEETTSTEPSSQPNTTSTEPANEGEDTTSTEPVEVELPLVDDTYTFDYWIANGSSFENFSTYADNEFYKWMEERTNVHLNFIHPASGSEKATFQTMVLSNDYPDFVQSVKSYYDGGVDKAIADGFLLRLNDAVDDWMPNYRAEVYGAEETFIQAVSDQGNLWAVHHIVDRPQGSWVGLGVRADWLEQSGLTAEDCETIDGLETVLTAFKDLTYENQGPLFLGKGSACYSGGLNGSYDVITTGYGTGILNVDGKASYTALQPLFKDYAAKMADWYAKGLINAAYVAEARSTPAEDFVVNSYIGVFDFVYTGLKTYQNGAANSELQPDDDFDLIAIASPKLNASDDWSDIHIRNTQSKIRAGNSMGITTHCSDLELACKFWDYAWSDEGKIASNWGEQLGEYGDQNATYYIDETDANGDGHVECYQPWLMEKYQNVTYVQTKYAVHNGPTYSIWSREWCVLSEKEIGYTKIWDQVEDDHIFPDGVTLTKEEGDIASSILANVNTAVGEWLAAVITGTKSVDTYETELVPQIQTMGIDTCVAQYQTALERYFERISYLDD